MDNSDGGATWQESATPRDTGPAGSLATFTIDDRLTFLATTPPGGVPAKKTSANHVVPATDGSFWAACAAGPCVQVTRDHGATWQILSRMDGVTTVDWAASDDGLTVYASARSGSTMRLRRSTDGGTAWTSVLDLGHPSAGGLALPGGDLILAEATEAGGMFRLPSGATQLQKLVGAPAHPSAMYFSGGVVVAARAWDERRRTGPRIAGLDLDRRLHDLDERADTGRLKTNACLELGCLVPSRPDLGPNGQAPRWRMIPRSDARMARNIRA